MLPLLRYLADGEQQRLRDLIDHLAQEFSLTVEERRQLLPSGQRADFRQPGWLGENVLEKGCVARKPASGLGTDHPARRLDVLKQNPERIDIDFLKQFEEFRAFIAHSSTTTVTNDVMPSDNTGSPEELLEQAYETLKQNLLAELLEQVKEASAAFFERLVVELLVRMGYGGSFQEAARTIGRSGDEGIDGIIKEDRLGFDVVYVQAKRWGQTVGRPEVEKFAGALQGQRARKGVFITTSTFTEEARQYVEKIDSKIVLVDGERLAELMFEHNVGVSTVTSYPVKRIDNDFFLEE